jgi:hypothetical protein
VLLPPLRRALSLALHGRGVLRWRVSGSCASVDASTNDHPASLRQGLDLRTLQ